MTSTAARMSSRLAVSSLIAVMLLGCAPRAQPTVPNTPKPTKPVDGDAVIEGLRAALGPDEPIRFTSTSQIKVGKSLLTLVTDGDYQGNQMDAEVKFREGNLQFSFKVIVAEGKAFVRPYGGDWAKSDAKIPPEGTGPFGDLEAADLEFTGPAVLDERFYAVEWKNAPYVDRSVSGTLLTKVKIKSSTMAFDVRSTGSPSTARFLLEGSGRYKGKAVTFEMQGIYRFLAIREPLEFTAPIE